MYCRVGCHTCSLKYVRDFLDYVHRSFFVKRRWLTLWNLCFSPSTRKAAKGDYLRQFKLLEYVPLIHLMIHSFFPSIFFQSFNYDFSLPLVSKLHVLNESGEHNTPFWYFNYIQALCYFLVITHLLRLWHPESFWNLWVLWALFFFFLNGKGRQSLSICLHILKYNNPPSKSTGMHCIHLLYGYTTRLSFTEHCHCEF